MVQLFNKLFKTNTQWTINREQQVSLGVTDGSETAAAGFCFLIIVLLQCWQSIEWSGSKRFCPSIPRTRSDQTQ